MNTSVIQNEESTLNARESLSGVSEPRKQILIVESDKDGDRKLALQLAAGGYETTTHDPANAVAAAKKSPPDLVIVDISTLSEAGFSLAERIQQSVRWCVPTIFLTSVKESRLREKAEVFEAAGFFEGAFDGKELVSAVDLALREGNFDETVETLSE